MEVERVHTKQLRHSYEFSTQPSSDTYWSFIASGSQILDVRELPLLLMKSCCICDLDGTTADQRKLF